MQALFAAMIALHALGACAAVFFSISFYRNIGWWRRHEVEWLDIGLPYRDFSIDIRRNVFATGLSLCFLAFNLFCVGYYAWRLAAA